MEDRHHLTFEVYEEGRITLDEYLNLVVFHQRRPFTRSLFRHFMFQRSKPFPYMIELVSQLKLRMGGKIAIVSNEGRELNAYRMQKFNLHKLADYFISSCFVHTRKPDVNIFRRALDVAQVQVSQSLFIDNTPMFVQIAEELAFQSILHIDLKPTRILLSEFCLSVGE